jgi:hypothetical protein
VTEAIGICRDALHVSKAVFLSIRRLSLAMAPRLLMGFFDGFAGRLRYECDCTFAVKWKLRWAPDGMLPTPKLL